MGLKMFDEILKGIFNIYYFSSWWIGNLGVVPWFWFFAFLLLPIFVFLLARRLRVTLVLETIIFSLTYLQFRQMNLTKLTCYVKVFIFSFIIFPTFASEKQDLTKQIFLSIGQVYEIKESAIDNYTIGNKEIIKAKLHNNALLINAKKLGHCEILIWNRQQTKKKIIVNVIPKSSLLKQQQLKYSLEKLNLKLTIGASFYEVSGKLENLDQYQRLKKIILTNSKTIKSNGIELSSNLKKEILIEIYDVSLNNQIDQLDCNFQSLLLICYFDNSNRLSKETIQYFKDNFFIKLIPLYVHSNRMFQAKLNIIQIENHKDENFNIGLDKIDGQLAELFNLGLSSILKRNSFLLNNKNIEISTIAKPETVIRFNHPAQIRIGSDIPFTTTGVERITNTQWRFAGLDIDLHIEPKGDYILANFKTNFTKPAENNTISGGFEKSSALLNVNSSLKLFDITFQSLGKENSKMPFLSSIPILGKIFTSSKNVSSYKKIIGYLLIEEIKI